MSRLNLSDFTFTIKSNEVDKALRRLKCICCYEPVELMWSGTTYCLRCWDWLNSPPSENDPIESMYGRNITQLKALLAQQKVENS